MFEMFVEENNQKQTWVRQKNSVKNCCSNKKSEHPQISNYILVQPDCYVWNVCRENNQKQTGVRQKSSDQWLLLTLLPALHSAPEQCFNAEVEHCASMKESITVQWARALQYNIATQFHAVDYRSLKWLRVSSRVRSMIMSRAVQRLNWSGSERCV